MNNLIVLFLSLYCITCFVKCNINVSDPMFRELPPIFRIDDEDLCKAEDKLFCKVSVAIQPSPNWTTTNLYWSIIEDTIKHSKFYNHNELYHAICLNDFCPNASLGKDINLDNIAECYRLKYKSLDVLFHVREVNCLDSENYLFSSVIDKIVLILVIAYLSIIFFATYKDHRNDNNNNNKAKQGKTESASLVKTFSVISNWNKLCTLNDRPDFQRLKFIQGIRFYNMLLIIFCHTQCSYLGAYIANTEYLELIYRNPIRLIIATLSVFLVQTFFLISAFLLSYHVCQSMENYHGTKIKYAFYTFLNRYLRILPPVSAMLLLVSTNWMMAVFDGPLKDIYSRKEFQRCKENWWTNVLFINNHYNENDMCYFITWYLAADTQLYLLSLLILLVIWKCPQKRKIILGLMIFVGVLIPAFMCYKYGLDIIYRLTPENSKLDNYRSFQFNAIYTSTYTNMASYMLGLALGCFYFASEKCNKSIKKTQFGLACLFSILPILTVIVSSQNYSRLVSLVLSGLVKPCYALGIGAGILAMSHKRLGLARWFCELKPVLFFGNFTYSTYVAQFGIVFFRTATVSKPLYVSDYVLVTSFVWDALLSLFFGFLMHILVEMPALQLQKQYIPQIRHLGIDTSRRRNQ